METVTQSTQETNLNITPTGPRCSRKKKLILGCAAAVVIIAVSSSIPILRGSVFDRLTSQMLSEYPYADNARGADGSYLKIDTNPYDRDFEELQVWEAATFARKQQDSLDGIKFMNQKLGFTDAVYSQMLETSALMGRQTAETGKYRVSWTYHPDQGLEVMYEKK